MIMIIIFQKIQKYVNKIILISYSSMNVKILVKITLI
jgi:hypothetical protein